MIAARPAAAMPRAVAGSAIPLAGGQAMSPAVPVAFGPGATLGSIAICAAAIARRPLATLATSATAAAAATFSAPVAAGRVAFGTAATDRLAVTFRARSMVGTSMGWLG
jgi:hypothetical protein